MVFILIMIAVPKDFFLIANTKYNFLNYLRVHHHAQVTSQLRIESLIIMLGFFVIMKHFFC